MGGDRDREYLTVGEFERWREGFHEWQVELKNDLASGFDGINDRLDKLNDRTRKNSEDIVAVREGGCKRFRQHPVRRNWGWVASISAVLVAGLELLKVIAEKIKGVLW